MLLAPISFAPLGPGAAGAAYDIAAPVLGGGLLLLAIRVLREQGGGGERCMFQFSFYLFILFLVLIVERLSLMAFAQLA